MPKVGKTAAAVELADLQDTLIIDTEEGTETYTTTKVTVRSTAQLQEVIDAITQEGIRRHKEGKRGADLFPYKFIVLDTLDKFEEYAEKSATEKYRKSKLNSKGKFEENGYTSVTELPDGNGYQYLRKEVMEYVEKLSEICMYLILIVHIKEKLLLDKNNQDVKVNDISLTGKLSSMVCAKADGIGYMYRNKDSNLWVSFETYEGAVMGARQKYLAGKKMPFDWRVIYPEVFEEAEIVSSTIKETA